MFDSFVENQIIIIMTNNFIKLSLIACMLPFILFSQLPTSPPIIPTVGAVESGVYRNMFVEAGYTQAQVNTKVDNAFQALFYGSNTNPNSGKCVYFPVGTDEAYIYAFDSNDVRTEGMSYAMMICVQLDKKVEFDRLWKWAYTHMRHSSGEREGHFAWKCSTTGDKLDPNSASDGEEYFATALFFAANRWGNGTGIFNYQQEADNLLVAMQNKTTPVNGVTNFFNVTEKQVVFVPYGSAADFTDPSYHVPAFYEVWAEAASSNNAFWAAVATKSRQFFPTTAHPTTGLMPDYSYFNGAPYANFGANHAEFQFDAYRCIMNMAVDYAWYKKDDIEKTLSKRLHAFFASQGGVANYPSIYQLDGTPNNSFGTFHSSGLAGCNGVGTLASDDVLAWQFVQDLYNVSQPDGLHRYYDGLLYMMSLLHVSGQFKAYIPSNVLNITENNTLKDLKSYPNPVQDSLFITNNATINRIEIFNNLGQKIFGKTYNKRSIDIDFSVFNKGVYFVKTYSDNKFNIEKIIKN